MININKNRPKNFRHFNPFLAGVLGIAGMLLFYVTVLSFFESLKYAYSQMLDLWYYMVPLILGFGIQVGLHQYIKNCTQGMEKMVRGKTLASGAASAGSMVMCCVHHLAEILTLVGLTAFTGYLIQYQKQFLLISLAVNIFFLFRILAVITKHRLYKDGSFFSQMKHWSFGRIYSVLWIVVIAFTMIQTMPEILAYNTETPTEIQEVSEENVDDQGPTVVTDENEEISGNTTQESSEQTEHDIEITSDRKVGFEQDGVTYDITFLPEISTEDEWIFQVALNTHYVDLDQLNLAEYLTFIGAITLKGEADGITVKREGSGHHISDYIYVPKEITGVKTIDVSTKEIEMIFSLNESSNSLTWQLE